MTILGAEAKFHMTAELTTAHHLSDMLLEPETQMR